MNEAQKYLIENGISDIVINSDVFPDNTPENADNWVYLSDVLDQYERHRKGQSLPIDSVSYCAEQTKNVLTNKFCNIAKEHVGETFDKVPEATDILKAIDVIEKHCS